ncbi:CHASE domain-containing protein [Roseibium marinum]|uniref:histidine kinase n=1 Tax=Roseibium marinum TaxID=281252 RepID=A0A2S3UXW2_9HYPH|nr:CHASE domain-containing protein [Roseibium marinum]POF32289.1 PAS domain-containing protein [Roseibium marinum]
MILSILRIFAIAIVYAALGKFGLQLAIPPGYATVIWPPSGIAVAVILAYGHRVWPGIFIGSFLTNFSLDTEAGSLRDVLQTAAVPAGIAVGAVLQAVASSVLVHKFAGYPNRLETEKQAFSFFFWAGPVACLINSTIGTSILYAAGKVSITDYLTNLGTWWAGDTIGVFIFAPLSLVWILGFSADWKPRRMMVTVPILVSFMLTVILTVAGTNFDRERLQLNFARQAASLPPALERTLEQHINVLDSLAGLRVASPDLDRQIFKAFSDRSFRSFEGIQALSWNPVIYPQDLAEFEQQTRDEGFEEFAVVQRDATGKLVPVSDRQDYIAVHFIEPYDINKGAHGFDVGSNATRRQAFEKARDTGQPVATSRITLVQERGEQFGVLVFMPVYKQGTAPETIEERRQYIDGYMVGVLRGDDIVNAALDDIAREQFTFRLFDDSARPDEQFLFQSRRADDGVGGLDETGVFGGATQFTVTTLIDFAGRHWRFEINPTPEFLAQNRSANSWIILLGGVLITGFIASFFLLVSGRSEMLRAMVMEKTRSLSISEHRLAQAQRIASLGNWELDIETGVFWWSDEVNRILNTKPDKASKTVDLFLAFIHPDDRSLISSEMTRLLNNRGALNIDCRLLLSDGAEKVVQLQAEVACEEGERPTRVIGTLQDVSERKKLDRMKDEFISTVSHELRTPLTSIQGSLGLLMAKAGANVDEKSQKLLQLSYDNCQRLSRLVNDILDIEKIAAGKMEYRLETVEICRLVSDVVERQQSFAEKYGVEFEQQFDVPEVHVKLDQDRFNQALVNLLSNAAKFSDEGDKVEIRVSLNSAGEASISVRDHGQGIPEAFRSKVFEKFAQADGSETRMKGGSGLGLNITKKIIEAFNGTVEFESEEGVGSIFTFTLPVCLPDEKASVNNA